MTSRWPHLISAEAAARANVYLDATMSTEEDLDAYRDAIVTRVRAECAPDPQPARLSGAP